MVHTFLQQQPRGFAQKFIESAGPAYERSGELFRQEEARKKLLSEAEQKRQQLLGEERQRLSAEDVALKRLGLDLSGTSDPKLREKIVSGLLVSPEQARNAEQKKLQDQVSYDIVKDLFNPEFADLWSISSPGAQTALISQGLDYLARGEDINKLLSRYKKPKSEKDTFDKKQPEKEYTLNVAGKTPKEIQAYKSELRKENKTYFDNATTKTDGLTKELFSLKQLENLSDKVPEGIFGKAFSGINPMTGELLIPELANAETELFVKTVNNFITAAKDTFGARVTNFELEAFMNRLPKLSNSKEGRRLIINQMKYLAELDQMYYKELKDVYRQFGQENITPEDADRIAEERIKDKAEKLTAQFDKDFEKQKELLVPSDEVIAEYLQQYTDPTTGIPDEQAIRNALIRDGYEL